MIRINALAYNVLAVAELRVDGWRAYIAPVPGKSHTEEASAVLKTGCKLEERVARAIFPSFADEKYAR